YDEYRHRDARQVLHPQLPGLAWRMQGIAHRDDADEAVRERRFGREHRRHAPAHRLAAREQRPFDAFGDGIHDGPEGTDEHRRLVGCTSLPRLVGKVEGHDADAVRLQVAGSAAHPRMVVAGTGARREYEGGPGAARGVV